MEPQDWTQQGVDDQHSSSEVHTEKKSLLFEKYSKHPVEGDLAFPLPPSSWWNYASPELLAEYEKLMLSAVKGHIEHAQVPIEEDPNTKEKVLINTIKLRKSSDNQQSSQPSDEPHETVLQIPTTSHPPPEQEKGELPLVMLHGFAAAMGFWLYNLDAFASYTTVYAIDWLGFGRSSRKPFVLSSEAKRDPTGLIRSKEAEDYFINSLERWREVMKLDKFIVLGHSMGAYLASLYAIRYPNRVVHLILADPWGVPAKPAEEDTSKIPLKWRIVRAALTHFNPLASVRALGPLGSSAIKKARRDVIQKFVAIFGEEKSAEIISQYIFQSNAITPSSGEDAFVALTVPVVFAANPLINRLHEIDKKIPVNIFYGDISWMDKSHGYEMKRRMRSDCEVELEIISESGHHIYADNVPQFNSAVQRVLARYSSPSSSSSSSTTTSSSLPSL